MRRARSRARPAGRAAACVGAAAARRPRRRRPRRAAPAGNALNVLLVTIDTLRADHLGAYGYRAADQPAHRRPGRAGALLRARVHVLAQDARQLRDDDDRPACLARTATARRTPCSLDFNPTLASVLKRRGLRDRGAWWTTPTWPRRWGYAKGFDSYRETWEEPALETGDGPHAGHHRRRRRVPATRPRAARPFFLWLHYVNPHAPYTPPPPYDTAFLDAAADGGSAAARGPGVPRRHPEAVGGGRPGPARLLRGAVRRRDRGRGRGGGQGPGRPRRVRAARAGPLVVLTSDHGESLGEHDYYFDHGEDLFEPEPAPSR